MDGAQFSWLWQAILTLAASALGWISRELYSDMKALREMVHSVELNYVQKYELTDMRKEMKEGFQEIKELLRERK